MVEVIRRNQGEVDALIQRHLHSGEQLRARYVHLRSVVEALHHEERSPDGTVTVEFSGGPHLVGLRLTPQAMRTNPETLAATIMAAVQAGSRVMAEKLGAEVGEMTQGRVDVAKVVDGVTPGLGGVLEREYRVATATQERTHRPETEQQTEGSWGWSRGARPHLGDEEVRR